MDDYKNFNERIDDFNEINTNIEDVSFTLLADRGAEKMGYEEKDGGSPVHFHSCYEVFYVREGGMKISIGEKTLKSEKDSVLIVSPKLLHRTKLESGNSSRYCFWFLFEKNSLKTIPSLYEPVKKIFSSDFLYIEKAASLYDSIKSITENFAFGNRTEVSICFYRFIIEIMRKTGNLQTNSPDALFRDNSVSRTYKIQKIVSTFYMEDISLEFIAEKLCLSTRQVNRIIQGIYGCSYREIISRTRIEAAARLLVTSDIPVSGIALKVGYQSLRGFYSAFKKHYDCLPKKYRLLNMETAE